MNFLNRSRLLVLVALAAGALSACRGGDSTGFASDFALTSPDGKTVTLSGQKGRVVLLNFWATWCDSCKDEIPALQELRRSDVGSRFELLSVSVDDDPSKAVPPFAAKYGLKYPILYADRKTLDAYAVRMLPTTFLIAPDGSIVRRYVGPLDARAVENDILSLLNRRPS
jgi:cytochrome c biogenesis protein CcmG/thiol:disulfide interchange protein DsbE